ncbi:B3/B4 domain-containing protein [[Eubacterium] cellulosolvens]
MLLSITEELKNRYPNLQALVSYIDNVKVAKSADELEVFSQEIFSEVKHKYTLSNLKDVPIFRSYRDFFWQVGIDPTKVRPAAEALIRRILAGKTIPKINNLVDSYNLASIKTEVALAAFNRDELIGDLIMRQSKVGEKFFGIGMNESLTLTGSEVVITDSEQLVAIYPHRDAEISKITSSTRNILLLTCGVPGIDMTILNNAREHAEKYITKFCGGKNRQ